MYLLPEAMVVYPGTLFNSSDHVQVLVCISQTADWKQWMSGN